MRAAADVTESRKKTSAPMGVRRHILRLPPTQPPLWGRCRAPARRRGSSPGLLPPATLSHHAGYLLCDRVLFVRVPLDVVFADVDAVLDFDEFQGDAAGVGDLVEDGLRDEDGLAFVEHDGFLALRDAGGAAEEDPVLAAVVVHLLRDGFAGLDADFLHGIALAPADDLRCAPRMVNRRMLDCFFAAEFFEAVHDVFDLLRLATPGDEDDVVGLHDEEVIEADAGDEAVTPDKEGVVAVERQDVAARGVAFLVLREDVVHGVPGADVVPVAGEWHHANALAALGDSVVDGDIRHVGKMRHSGVVAVREDGGNGGLVGLDFALQRTRRKGEHAGVPVVVASGHVFLRGLEVGLFAE